MVHRRTLHRSVKMSSPVRYDGNLLFLIIFLILWLPLGILLLLRHGSITTKQGRLVCSYHGSWGWLFFWGFIFFPVAIVLLFIKGLDIIEEAIIDEQETLIERY